MEVTEDIVNILKMKYLNSLKIRNIKEKEKQEYNYFSALILQRGSYNPKLVKEHKENATPQTKEFYEKLEKTVKKLEAFNFLTYDIHNEVFNFSSEKEEEKLKTSLFHKMIGENDKIVQFSNKDLTQNLASQKAYVGQLLSDDEEVMKFLYTSSKMLPFSFNNKIMAHAQSMKNGVAIDALQSRDFWNKKNIFIRKGEKGIDLIVPSKFPLFELERGQPKLTIKGNKIPQVDENGNFKFGLRFVLKKAFDVSQMQLNQFQKKEYELSKNYDNILKSLEYTIKNSKLKESITFDKSQNAEEQIRQVLIKITDDFSGTNEQKNALKFLLASYTDIYIPHDFEFLSKEKDALEELKDPIEYSKVIAKTLEFENIFFSKEKNVFELKGVEDAKREITTERAREHRNEIDTIESQEYYLNAYKYEYKKGQSNGRTNNIYNHNDRERSERTRNSQEEKVSQRTDTKEAVGKLQGEESQGDTSSISSTNEPRGLQRERGMGDSDGTLLQRDRVEDKLLKIYQHLSEHEYNSVEYDKNISFLYLLNTYGRKDVESFPHFENKKYLEDALGNPTEYNILEVDNYGGSAAKYLLIKNEYSFVYESKIGKGLIEISELNQPLTSETAWKIKEENSQLMQMINGEYHVVNNQLAEYKKYPTLGNNNSELVDVVMQETSNEDVTSQNISNFYNNFTDKEKEDWQDRLDSLFQSRATEIRNEIVSKILEISNREDTRENRTSVFFEYGDFEYKGDGHNIVGITFFNIKDELRPISEYIESLKKSSEMIKIEESTSTISKALIKNSDYIKKETSLDYQLLSDSTSKFLVEGQEFIVNRRGIAEKYGNNKEYLGETSSRKETILEIKEVLENIRNKESYNIITSNKLETTSLFDVAHSTKEQKKEKIDVESLNFPTYVKEEIKQENWEALKGMGFPEIAKKYNSEIVKHELFESLLEKDLLLFDDYEKSIEGILNNQDRTAYIGYFSSEEGIEEIESLFIDKFKEDIFINNKRGIDNPQELLNITYTAIVDKGDKKYTHVDERDIKDEDFERIIAYIETTGNGSYLFPLRVPVHVDFDKHEKFIREMKLGSYADTFSQEKKISFPEIDALIEKQNISKEHIEDILKSKFTRYSDYDKYAVFFDEGKIHVRNNLSKEVLELKVGEQKNLSQTIEKYLKIGEYSGLKDDGKFAYEYDGKQELKILNLKEQYSIEEIDSEFIHKGVKWEIFSNKYIFDLGYKIHRDLLSNKLNILEEYNDEALTEELSLEELREQLMQTAIYIRTKTGVEWEWMDDDVVEFVVNDMTFLMNGKAETTVYESAIGAEHGTRKEIETNIDDVVDDMLLEKAKEEIKEKLEVVEITSDNFHIIYPMLSTLQREELAEKIDELLNDRMHEVMEKLGEVDDNGFTLNDDYVPNRTTLEGYIYEYSIQDVVDNLEPIMDYIDKIHKVKVSNQREPRDDKLLNIDELKEEITKHLKDDLKEKLTVVDAEKIIIKSDGEKIVTLIYPYGDKEDKVSMGMLIEDYSSEEISRLVNDMHKSIEQVNKSMSLSLKEEKEVQREDFIIETEDKVGAKTKFRNNVNAIEVIDKLKNTEELSQAERLLLSKYTGWGGIPQAFYKSDGTTSKGWNSEAEELKSVMEEKAYSEARRSTLDSFYTPANVTREMWRAIDAMGFKGGNILEPSVGIGGFVGTMPTKFKTNTKVYGIELDSTTSKIVTELYPSVKVFNIGFQDFSMDHTPATLVIGNPPFGDTKYEHHDKENNSYRKLSIHNYFMAKSIDSLEEGGVMAMVVSNAFLDAKDDTTRKYIHQSSDLMGAIRLPNNAFKDSAHTEVTTDIVFFRKRLNFERADSKLWLELSEINDTPINRYFTYSEENLLGEWGKHGTMYGGGLPALVTRKGDDVSNLLSEAIDRLPKSMEINDEHKAIFDYARGNVTQEEKTISIGSRDIKVGSLFVQTLKNENNEDFKEINVRLPDVNGKPSFEKIEYTSKRKNVDTGEIKESINYKQMERVEGMIGLVNIGNHLRKAQIDKDYSSEDIEVLREELEATYDAFVKKHGHLNSNTNKRLFSRDVDAPFLLSLERKYDKGVTSIVGKKTGESTRSPSVIKADIFSTRTQYPYLRPSSAKDEEDALYIALGESGYVDIPYIASLVNQKEEMVEKTLTKKGFIFDDPKEGWVTREEYLSGNVKVKLKETVNPQQIEALKSVIPKDIEAHEISVQFGAGWIPSKDMNEFLKEITQKEAKSTYVAFGATWTININPTDSSKREWETSRVDIKKLLLSSLNNKQMIVYDTYTNANGNEARRVNEDETIAANDKMEAIKDRFDKWIWNSEERRERLGKRYNDKFNTHAPRTYDGSHLKLIGKVDDSLFELRPHQANAVYRGVVDNKILLDHTVGTGKTATLIATIMEMKRMNKVNKPLLAVPNHLVGQWSKEWLELYPNANILATDKRDFEKSNRQILFSKITTGNYDVIIIAHSQLTKIQNDPDFTERFLNEQIDTINTAIDSVREVEGKDTRTVKQFESTRMKLEAQIAGLLEVDRDNLITFKELGVDALAVDEAHEFKNLQYTTSLQRIGGLGNPEGSKKAFDLFIKVRALGEETGEKNVFFLTGTPISNTIAEMYTMQKYLDYQQLKDNDILHFDAWVKQYAEVVADWELSPSGKYQMRSRLAKFKNMPELMQSYRSFADVVTREQIQKHLEALGKTLGTPNMIGGKPNNVINERSEQQAKFIGVPNEKGKYDEKSLVYRSENIPKKPQKGDDNMLVIMSEARKCALDMRLINPHAKDDEHSKVNIMMKHLLEQYKRWEDFKGAQLIFCDLSTPKGSNQKEQVRIENLVILSEKGTEEQRKTANKELSRLSEDDLVALKSSFDVYNDIKSKLIKNGIPSNEIAFIHDANTDKKKSDLFDMVNGGKIRFLVGSTSKMGAGMNAQQRLVGLHHLDAPWRPSDLEQREGRIIRQGNFIYNLFDKAKGYNDDKSDDNLVEFKKALKLVGMKIDVFKESLGKLEKPIFEVMVNRYATKATLDSRMWQTLETKARFIEQIKLAGFTEREVEDISLESSNSAEMKAISSGNPLILKEMQLKKEIKKLEALSKSHMFMQYRLVRDVGGYSKTIEAFSKKEALYKEDIKEAAHIQEKIEKDGFSIELNDKRFIKREDAGREILKELNNLIGLGRFESNDSKEIGALGDYKIHIERVGHSNSAVVSIEGNNLYEFNIDIDSSAIGIATKVVNVLNRPEVEYDELVERYSNAKIELPRTKNQISDFNKEDELLLIKEQYKQVIIELRPKEEDEEENKIEDSATNSHEVDEENRARTNRA
jgi:N12 class adenine-specific DNA methylase